MCLAIFKPKNQNFPSEKTLKIAWKNNSDGAGIAIKTEQGIKIIKGLMTLDSLLNELDDSLKKFDVVIHLRYATSGFISSEMTHPFPVSNDRHDLKSLDLITDTAIIHNGVLFSPRFDTVYSDTAIFARYLAIKGINYNHISSIIGDDRLAIMTKNGVELLGQWYEIDGLHYSNTYSIQEYSPKNHISSYLNDPFYASSSDDWAMYDSRHFLDDDDALEYCPHCLSDEIEHIGLKSLTFECLSCGTVFNETQFLLIEDEIKKTKKIKVG